jgi:hypothetical protein
MRVFHRWRYVLIKYGLALLPFLLVSSAARRRKPQS